jgi:hypothetical protein
VYDPVAKKVYEEDCEWLEMLENRVRTEAKSRAQRIRQKKVLVALGLIAPVYLIVIILVHVKLLSLDIFSSSYMVSVYTFTRDPPRFARVGMILQ